jgi:putative nucleotidyltransferase with HDIG domain
MSLLNRLRLLPGLTPPPPRKRKTAEVSGTVEFLETSRVVAALIFFATVAAIVLISFVGINPVTIPLLPNQVAPVRLVANSSFSYISAEKTKQTRDQRLDRLPPVYRLDMEPLHSFETAVRDLFARLDKVEHDFPHESAERHAALINAIDAFNAHGNFHVAVEDAATLLNAGDAKMRQELLENGLLSLKEIYNEGVEDGHSVGLNGRVNGMTVYQITKPTGEISQRPVQSMEDALTFLRINLTAEGTGREVSNSLFRIFRYGLRPNVIFDSEATARLRTQAIEDIKPIEQHVDKGQVLVDAGTVVNAEQYEMLEANRKHVLEAGDSDSSEGLQFFGRILLVLGMVMASGFYIRLEDRETLQSNGRLGLLALVVIFNLSLVRATYSLSDLHYFIANTTAASLLPYIAPTALAPLIVAVLIDAGSAIFMALLISIFTSVIYGNRLDLLVLTFLASMVGIFSCRNIRKRGRLVRAAGLGGVTVAVFVLLMGAVEQLPLVTILKQMAAGLGTGFFTGIVVVGVLPVLEGLFKRTTDITLLELTDYNHPLLRLMQMEAPGTYHHSLVVAQLAENAANAIGANPLLARVCALFHDIGKTKKPEYFTENQRERTNPHDENNPSLSALIIKAHVKDGIDLALKHRLPRAVIDVIQQHHGTTLIRFFFQRAVNDSRLVSASNPSFTRPIEPQKVCETTYRYDGPRPQFKESAIIHLADGVEAASRSMRKITPQHLGELIDQIFRDRIEDSQLDEAPLTFEELSKIRSSFTFTLLNMLHSRVGYAPADEADAPATTTTPKAQPASS